MKDVTFQQAWPARKIEFIVIDKNTIPIYFIGLDDLIRNKESLNRPKDQEDLKYLKKIQERTT
jgi:hypothetical protein